MVYGKILFNNIKEYTPKWYPTIPYSQTVKPTFGHKRQVVSNFNSSPSVKNAWRNFGFVFQRHSFMWQVFIFSVAFASYYAIEVPILWIYQQNNTHRTYETHMKKERAYKKEQREKEEAQQ